MGQNPNRFFMMRRFVGQLDPAAGSPTVQVRIELECGCVVDRMVDPSRVLETNAPDGGIEILIPGKFICGEHSF